MVVTGAAAGKGEIREESNSNQNQCSEAIRRTLPIHSPRAKFSELHSPHPSTSMSVQVSCPALQRVALAPFGRLRAFAPNGKNPKDLSEDCRAYGCAGSNNFWHSSGMLRGRDGAVARFSRLKKRLSRVFRVAFNKFSSSPRTLNPKP